MSCLSEKWRTLTWGNAGTQMHLESPRVTPVNFHLTGGQTLIPTCQVGDQLISQPGEMRHYHRILDVQRLCLGELMGFIFVNLYARRICNSQYLVEAHWWPQKEIRRFTLSLEFDSFRHMCGRAERNVSNSRRVFYRWTTACLRAAPVCLSVCLLTAAGARLSLG